MVPREPVSSSICSAPSVVFGERKCPHCEGTIPHEQTFFGHLCDHHIDFDVDALPRTLEGDSSDIMHLASILPYFV